MKDSPPLIKKSLALRLLKVVFSIYLCITIVITLVQMLNEYLLEERFIKDSLIINQAIFQENLVTSIWNFDSEQLTATVHGMLKQPIMVGIEILDEHSKVLIKTGQILNKNSTPVLLENDEETSLPYTVLFQHSFDLMRNNKIIGNVTLYSSSQVIFNKVKYNFLVIIINAIIKTIVLWLLFMWAFRKFLTQQLDIFCHAMESVDIDEQKNCFLNLETFDSYELFRIEYFFNDLLKRIIDSRDKLNILNKTLEQKVTERTQQLVEKQNDLEKLNSKLEQQIHIIDKNVIISQTDTEGRIVYSSEAFCAISGYSKAELLQQHNSIIYHPNTPKEIYADLWATLTSGKTWQGELLNRNKSGDAYWVNIISSPIFDEQQHITGYSWISQNISDKKLVEQLSITDELTQLYNRRYFNTIFPKEIQRAAREKQTISFLIFDIDYFKQYNDNYGHQKGDEVLRAIGKMLKAHCQRASDIALRLGGEEFGVIFSDLNHEEALLFAETIRLFIEDIKIEHRFSNVANHITASFGLVTLLANPDLKMDYFYKQADDLLYEAKDSGRNRVIQVCD